jgi:hypothetical protein
MTNKDKEYDTLKEPENVRKYLKKINNYIETNNITNAYSGIRHLKGHIDKFPNEDVFKQKLNSELIHLNSILNRKIFEIINKRLE